MITRGVPVMKWEVTLKRQKTVGQGGRQSPGGSLYSQAEGSQKCGGGRGMGAGGEPGMQRPLEARPPGGAGGWGTEQKGKTPQYAEQRERERTVGGEGTLNLTL